MMGREATGTSLSWAGWALFIQEGVQRRAQLDELVGRLLGSVIKAAAYDHMQSELQEGCLEQLVLCF